MHFFCRVITQVLPAWLASHRIADLLQQMLPKFSIHFIHMMQISNHLTIYPTFPPPFKGFIKSNCSQSIRRENSSIWQNLFICPNLAGGAQGTHFSALQKHYMYVFQKYFPISNFKENSFHIRRKFPPKFWLMRLQVHICFIVRSRTQPEVNNINIINIEFLPLTLILQGSFSYKTLDGNQIWLKLYIKGKIRGCAPCLDPPADLKNSRISSPVFASASPWPAWPWSSLPSWWQRSSAPLQSLPPLETML